MISYFHYLKRKAILYASFFCDLSTDAAINAICNGVVNFIVWDILIITRPGEWKVGRYFGVGRFSFTRAAVFTEKSSSYLTFL